MKKSANKYSDFKYIYPPNARNQEQLDIMLKFEKNGEDPMDINNVDQTILFTTDYWYVSENRFPYPDIKKQFLIVALNGVYDIKDMPMEMWIDLKSIWDRLVSEYDLPGGALCFRFGDPALSSASLKRVHAHIIVPKEFDGERHKVSFSIGGHLELNKDLSLEAFYD